VTVTFENQNSKSVYWFYGESMISSGTKANNWGFCAAWGYYDDGYDNSYVRRRILRRKLARWQTVDPIWPIQSQYGYCNNDPVQYNDYTGLQPYPITFNDYFNNVFNSDFPSSLINTLGDTIHNIVSCGCFEAVKPCKKLSSAFGFSKKNDKTNALGHCMTACCISKYVPRCALYWTLREGGMVAGHEASVMDDWNNRIGYGCASSRLSCYACCLASMNSLMWMEPTPHNWPPGSWGYFYPWASQRGSGSFRPR